MFGYPESSCNQYDFDSLARLFYKFLAENPLLFKAGDESLPGAKRRQIAVVFAQDTTGFSPLVVHLLTTLSDVCYRSDNNYLSHQKI